MNSFIWFFLPYVHKCKFTFNAPHQKLNNIYVFRRDRFCWPFQADIFTQNTHFSLRTETSHRATMVLSFIFTHSNFFFFFILSDSPVAQSHFLRHFPIIQRIQKYESKLHEIKSICSHINWRHKLDTQSNT